MEQELIDMDYLAQILCDLGMPAIIEQTGGGCATLYVGLADEDGYYWAAGGAGWFENACPDWKNARAHWSDFSWGADDDGATKPIHETKPREISELAQDIFDFAKRMRDSRA